MTYLYYAVIVGGVIATLLSIAALATLALQYKARAIAAERGKSEALALMSDMIEDAKKQGFVLVQSAVPNHYDWRNVRAETAEARIFEAVIHEIHTGRTAFNFSHVPEVVRALEWVVADIRKLREERSK